VANEAEMRASIDIATPRSSSSSSSRRSVVTQRRSEAEDDSTAARWTRQYSTPVPRLCRPLKFLIFKNPRWRTAAIVKTVKLPFLCNLLADFDEIWHGDACWSPATGMKFKFLIFNGGQPLS